MRGISISKFQKILCRARANRWPALWKNKEAKPPRLLVAKSRAELIHGGEAFRQEPLQPMHHFCYHHISAALNFISFHRVLDSRAAWGEGGGLSEGQMRECTAALPVRSPIILLNWFLVGMLTECVTLAHISFYSLLLSSSTAIVLLSSARWCRRFHIIILFSGKSLRHTSELVAMTCHASAPPIPRVLRQYNEAPDGAGTKLCYFVTCLLYKIPSWKLFIYLQRGSPFRGIKSFTSTVC